MSTRGPDRHGRPSHDVQQPSVKPILFVISALIAAILMMMVVWQVAIHAG